MTIIKVSTKAIGINADKVNRGDTKGFEPAIIVQRDNGKAGFNYLYAHGVEILDESGKVVAIIKQDDLRPEISGARVWIETDAVLRCITNEGKDA